MTEERKLPFAAYPTDDGKAVSIITDREDTESYLLFTNKAVNQFTDVLTEALGFDEKDAFYLNWKDGEFIYGWNWTDGTALHLEAGLTFGEMIEQIVSMYSQSKEYEETTWKNDPDNFGMKKLQGYEIYQNLSRYCIPLLEKKGEMKLPDGVDDKTLYKTLESIVSVELVEQIGNRVSIDGKTILPKLRSEGICGDPLALAGLCLLWHDLFFDFSHTGRMKKEDLQDRNLLKRCKKVKCEYQSTDALLWESESRNGEVARAWIVEERCYCGKTRIVAKRTAINETEPEVVDSTDYTMINKDKEIIIDPENPFDYGRYCGERAPEILTKEQTGFPEDMEFQWNTLEYPLFQMNDYKKNILTCLLCSIFDAKRNYDVEEQLDELDEDGNVKLDKDGNAKKVRNPAYGRREGDKELPLPENDIQLLVSKIVLKYEFFASTATDPYSDRKEGWSGGLNPKSELLQAMREGQFGYLLLDAHHNSLGYHGNIDIERLESEVKKNSAKDRAAKHRLGRKMSEIGRFLQWWDDLSPILEHLYGKNWKFTNKKKEDRPLRILKNGIRNVKGVNGD